MKKDFSGFKEFIKGKKVGVVGIGVSNTPLIYFLLKLGAQVSAFDKKNEEQLGKAAGELKAKGVRLVLGENYLDNLTGLDIIFKTPSMRIDNPALVKAAQEGAYITSEMEEFIRYCPAKIYGITGSDGKTTTTTIIYKMLSGQGYNTWVGGNIGTPLFTKIEEVKPEDRVVLELSSFQLMTMDVSPEIALITNLSPNHLDIHKNMEEYMDAKKNIFKHQNEGNTLVLNDDNEFTRNMVSEAKGNVLMFSRKHEIKDGAYYKDNILYINGEEVCSRDDIKLTGMHNVENYLAAFCCVCSDVSIENMKKVASEFTGVEHRCEFVREFNGVKYYNDSIATSPTRVLAGLKAFEKPVILIAGGYDKHLPFDVLAEEGYDKIKTLVLVGATKYKIKDAFDRVIKNKERKLPLVVADTFEEAVAEASKAAEKGDIVYLGPACAGFDLFKNFEERGKKFKELVLNMK